MARLRHPHVLTICDVFHQAETYAYTMEWIDGKSLAQVIEYLDKAEDVPLPVEGWMATRRFTDYPTFRS